MPMSCILKNDKLNVIYTLPQLKEAKKKKKNRKRLKEITDYEKKKKSSD